MKLLDCVGIKIKTNQSLNMRIVFYRFSSILACVLINITSISYAQQKLKFSIANFSPDPFDLSAKDAQYEKYDSNGERYAIIKVSSNNPDDNLNEYSFNFGYMKHIVEEHNGILWVYVQKNAKLVSITREGYFPINKYDLHTTIESGKNYVMSITSEAIKVSHQMVQFNIEPKSSKAVVMIKSFKEGSTEELFGYADVTGAVAKSLEYGKYSYRVLADNYHMSDGIFTLSDKANTYIENIVLRPNFSDITFKVDADAEIYINGEKKGSRQWSGTLKAGKYQVECRQINHKSTSQYIEVQENDNRTINLNIPEPILGTVSITSNPLGADINIDGKVYGKTPRNLDLLIGKHSILISKEGYQSESKSFEIKEEGTTDVSVSLGKITTALINSNPTNSNLYIDGTYKGSTPYTFEGEVGTHNVKLFYNGYKPIEKKVYFGNTNQMSFSLKKQYVKRTDFYIAAGVGAGSILNASASIGYHISNFNFELDYNYCFQESPKIYWNYIGDDYDYYPKTCTYAPSMILAGKLGYGVLVGTRFKLTPQIGYRFTKLAEYGAVGQIEGAYCSSTTIGLRMYLAFTTHFGISLTPEYIVLISQSEGFKTLSNVTSKIKNFGKGVNLNLSLVLTL